MTSLALVYLALAAARSDSQELTVGDRCALLAAVLRAPAKRGLSGGQRPQVVEQSFLQVEPVRDSATRRNHVIVRSRWQFASGYSEMFASGESCEDPAFILEHADPKERDSPSNPQGNSDHVVLVTIRRTTIGANTPLTFEEKLGLSIHARAPDGADRGGYAVPPIKFTGRVERTENGTWRAKIKTALFAS